MPVGGEAGTNFKLGCFLYGYAGTRAGGAWYDFKDNVIHGYPKKFDLMWGASRALIKEILLIEECEKN